MVEFVLWPEGAMQKRQVEEYLSKQQQKDLLAIETKLEHYTRNGLVDGLRTKKIKKFIGKGYFKLYEFIIKKHRFFGCLHNGKCYLVLVFKKQSNKTPSDERDAANACCKIIINTINNKKN